VSGDRTRLSRCVVMTQRGVESEIAYSLHL
jgi:hypothetical protein